MDGEGEANRAAGTGTPVMNARAWDGGDFVGGGGLGLYFMIHRRERDGSGERKKRKKGKKDLPIPTTQQPSLSIQTPASFPKRMPHLLYSPQPTLPQPDNVNRLHIDRRTIRATSPPEGSYRRESELTTLTSSAPPYDQDRWRSVAAIKTAMMIPSASV